MNVLTDIALARIDKRIALLKIKLKKLKKKKYNELEEELNPEQEAIEFEMDMIADAADDFKKEIIALRIKKKQLSKPIISARQAIRLRLK